MGERIEAFIGALAAQPAGPEPGAVHRGDVYTQLYGRFAERDVTTIAAVGREHIFDFIAPLVELRSPSTASVRYRGADWP